MTHRPASSPTNPTAATPSRPRGWLLGYPTDHLMGILHSTEDANDVLADLIQAGFESHDVTILVGEEAAIRIDGRGKHHGRLARLYRLVQFTQMDQAPDFRRYELEARRGHPVIAIRETSPDRRRIVRSILRSRGAHFINFYGRVYTETLDPFAGPDEGDLPI